MATVRANGRAFHVQTLGRGAPMAMVHGLVFGNLSSWYLTVAPRLARNRKVLLYDLRGHGRSEPATEGFRLADMAADLAALIEAAPEFEPPVDLVGHSYGGLIPLQLALNRPDLVRRVVVVDAPVPPFHQSDLDAFVPVDPESLLHDIPQAAEFLSALPESLRANVTGERRQRRRREDLARFRDETSVLDDLKAEPPLAVERIDRPVLCVYGRTSPFREKGERLAAAIPGARLSLLEAGHVIPYEAPAELAREIDGFLDG
ncbi:MAG TPA: alpha/beta hydrolase [Gemmatimonadota bacterium]|nr:alpha/beta hydrolase [Gemmatimonadota bacterium]